MLEAKAQERRAAHLPGDLNVWIFVLGDLVYFAGYFVIFMIYRIQEHAVFLESQRHLDVTVATVNTLVLLASSRYVALAVQSARAGDHERATQLVKRAGGLGVVFAGIKVFEWATEISRGYTLTTNEFFMFYFMLTATHLFHVLLGLGVLVYLGLELRTPGRQRTWVVEAGAVYWHMVDLVWIFMFALIYLVR